MYQKKIHHIGYKARCLSTPQKRWWLISDSVHAIHRGWSKRSQPTGNIKHTTDTQHTHRVTQMKTHSKRAQGCGNVKDQTFALNDSHCAYIEMCGSKEQIWCSLLVGSALLWLPGAHFKVTESELTARQSPEEEWRVTSLSPLSANAIFLTVYRPPSLSLIPRPNRNQASSLPCPLKPSNQTSWETSPCSC